MLIKGKQVRGHPVTPPGPGKKLRESRRAGVGKREKNARTACLLLTGIGVASGCSRREDTMHSDMIDWEPAGQLPEEALTSGPNGGPNLIEIYQALKNKYRNYDTKHALKRMQTLRRGVQHLADRGFPVALEILGSINFGIVEPNSDADLIVLHYCDLHLEDGECAPSCPNLLFESDALLRHMRQQPGSESSNIEVLDCINLRYVERLIQEERYDDAPMLFRLCFIATWAVR
jgi:hypothetical protein